MQVQWVPTEGPLQVQVAIMDGDRGVTAGARGGVLQLQSAAPPEW